ncbi:MAG TPA: serine hydrolase [Burkholderiaceae bacterium]|jgi:CubicO group peptidase (beta-lactamase class C family)
MLNKLDGFDGYMEQLLKDWNAPGVGVAIVKDNDLIFAKGYGYRDYENKLPFTPSTLFPIASNTKLFAAIAAGLLVEEGKLTFDKPIRDAVPSIRFYDNTLNDTVTLRDMLAHRTGITRHDMIWYKSNFTSKELFERLQFMKPVAPLRQTFIYNNMMYEAIGHITELLTGKSWAQFVQERILDPLDMKDTAFDIAGLLKKSDIGVPFSEKRNSNELHKISYFVDQKGARPAGSMVSNLQDMARWLVTLMNDGRMANNQVLPDRILKATLEPAISIPNTFAEMRGYWELFNSTYGMGRHTASYRGHLMTFHGGDTNGFHSQVSYLPREKIGVVTFVIGDHCAVVRDVIGYHIYERLLDLDHTPWSDRMLDIITKAKQQDKEARGKAGANKVPNTSPSHDLVDYVGEYENPAYGVLYIKLCEDQLQFDFREAVLPLEHFHYDRFDTPNDEEHGKWSVNFATNPMGDIDRAVMSLDQAEAIFTRRPESQNADLLKLLVGTYQTATALKFQISMDGGILWLEYPGQPKEKLIPYKGMQFRFAQFSDWVFEFILEDEQIKSLKQTNAYGEFVFLKI